MVPAGIGALDNHRGMPFVPPPFHVNRPGLVAPVRADPRGVVGPTPAEVRRHSWRRVHWGLHVPISVDSQAVGQRIVEAAALLPPKGAVTGWAALRWLGAAYFGGETPSGELLPVPLVSMRHFRGGTGVLVSEERLSPTDVVEVDGLKITLPDRSVWFEMRYAASERHAVRMLDMAAYSDLVSIDELVARTAANAGWTGIDVPRRVAWRCDENTWSPAETDMREIWTHVAGLPRPLCNQPLFDREGRHLGTPDLVDPVSGLVGEYDGALHLEGRQRRKDRERRERYAAHGLEVVDMIRGDAGRPEVTAARMRAAYNRCRFERPERRSWTVDLPHWWTPTFTVAQRRALTERQRERLLRYRLKVS